MSLAEQWKYERAYEAQNYRMGPARKKQAMDDLQRMTPGFRLLDVGCGRGEVLDVAKERGLIATGIETVPALCDGERIIHGDACALPFADSSFEYLTCYDVLEHLPPGTEQAALDEFRRVCSHTVFLSTNDRPSHLPDGTDLHVNKRPRAEWDADIVKRWPDACIIRSTFGPHKHDWHWRIWGSL